MKLEWIINIYIWFVYFNNYLLLMVFHFINMKWLYLLWVILYWFCFMRHKYSYFYMLLVPIFLENLSPDFYPRLMFFFVSEMHFLKTSSRMVGSCCFLIQLDFLDFFFLVRLVFEIRTSFLGGRHSYHLSYSLAPMSFYWRIKTIIIQCCYWKLCSISFHFDVLWYLLLS
jgi:hypothetical protein